MKPVTVSTIVDRPPAEVFEHLAVLANHEAFTDHMLVDWSYSGPEGGRHARARARSTAPGPAEWVEIEIVNAEAPDRLVERSVGAHGYRVTRGVYTLEPAGEDRTLVSFELTLERTPVYERLIAPVLHHWLREANQRALDRLSEALAWRPVAA